MADVPASPLPCPTCGRSHAAGGCWTVSGHKALTTATEHQRQKDQDTGWAAGYPAGATSRQGDVDTVTNRLVTALSDLEAARHAIVEDASTVADLQTKVADLTSQLAAAQRPPVVVVDQARPVPADAVWVAPDGSDSNPGTQAKPRKTPPGSGRVAWTPGTYPAAHFTTANESVSSWYVPPGGTGVFDGQGKVGNAITAGGHLDVYGDLQLRNYAPSGTGSNPAGCAAYWGSTAAGSEIDGMTILGSKSTGLGFGGNLLLTRLTVDGSGYCGILGTAADDMRFGAVRVLRTNRGKNPRGTGGQLAAIKMTRSKNLWFGPDVYVEDAGGANGLWTDVSCRNARFVRPKVLTGAGGTPAYIGLQIEETEGGVVVGGEFEGQYAGSLMASGHIQVWESKFTGTVTALQVKQDRPKNSGQPGNLTQAEAPWWTAGNMVSNSTLVGPTALAAFATAGYDLSADDMLDALKGNTLTGKVSLEGEDGTVTAYTPAQLAAYLGSEYDPTRQPIPPELVDMLTA